MTENYSKQIVSHGTLCLLIEDFFKRQISGINVILLVCSKGEREVI
jgi:hypothetical protein